MSSLITAQVLGYLGGDAELKYTQGGTAVVSLSIAATRKRNDSETTTWVRVSAFGGLAESLGKLIDAGGLRKGSQVLAAGELWRTEYTDREGFMRDSLEMFANHVQAVGSRGNSAPNPPAGNRRRAEASAPVDTDVSEIPF